MDRRVQNPLTGRNLRVGGGMYNDIVGTGRLVDNGQGQLVYQVVTGGAGTGITFMHPSGGAFPTLARDSPVPVDTPRRVAALNEFLAGRPYAEIRGRLGLVGFLDGWLEIHIDGLRITRDENDMEGRVLTAHPLNENGHARQLMREMRQGRVDIPVSLPFENVLLNARTPDSRWDFCGERILECPIAEHSWAGLVDAAEDAGIGLRIWSLTGDLRHSTLGQNPIGVLAHDNHFYRMADDKKPTLITGPEIKADEIGGDAVVRAIFDQHDACYYEMNGRAYLNDPSDPQHNGVYTLESTQLPDDVFKEWMIPYFRPKYGMGPRTNWCRTTFELARRYNTVLSKGQFMHERDFDASQYITIDMDKCYSTAFLHIFDGLLPFAMPFPTVFSEWRPCDPDTHEYCNDEWYAVQYDYSEIGGVPPLMPYMTMMLLKEHGYPWKPYAYISYAGPQSSGWKSREIRTIVNEGLAIDAEMQKEFVCVQGMWESACQRELMVFDLGKNGEAPDKPELDEYAADGFLIQHLEDGRAVLTRDLRKRRTSNRYHLSLGVKQVANYLVLRTLLKIKEHIGALPVKVKTDGLMYRRADIRQWAPPFNQPEPEDILAEFMVHIREGVEVMSWKFEESKPARANLDVRHDLVNVLDPPMSMQALYAGRNKTFFGPPGVGKTMTVRDGFAYDFAVAYTNDRAVANGGITVHSLFNVRYKNASPDWAALRPKLQDRTVWFDEVQMATMAMWGWFACAFEEFNMKLIMTGDPDQLCAIEDAYTRMKWDETSQFFGQVTTMVEHPLSRNADSPELIEMREAILEHNRIWTMTDIDAPYTVWNIAFHNDVCEWVNNQIAMMLGQVWGGDGLYVGHDPLKSHPTIVKATLYLRKGDLMTPVYMDLTPTGASTFWVTPAQMHQHKTKNLRWAYCQTGYKCIGKTFPADVDVTIWQTDQPRWTDRFRQYMYTAVTRVRYLSQVNFRSTPVPRPEI